MPYTTQQMEVKYRPVDMMEGQDFTHCRILDFEVPKPTSVQQYGEAIGWSQAEIDALIAERGEVFNAPNSRTPDGAPGYSEGRVNTPIGAIEALPSFLLLRVSNTGALLWSWTQNLVEIPAAERVTGGEGVDESRNR